MTTSKTSIDALEPPDGSRPMVVVRYSGAFGTKASNVRSRFLQKLRSNLQRTLEQRDIDANFDYDWDRLYVEPTDYTETDLGELVEPLTRVPGVQSLRASYSVPWGDLDDIVTACRDLWKRHLVSTDARTFAVRAQRVGDRAQFSFTSPEAAEAIGSELDVEGLEVDLEQPDIEIGVEIHGDEAYLYAGDFDGPGGLPVGVQGEALALVSGGFDSAVAAQRMYRRGVALDYLYVQMAGRNHLRGARRVIASLTGDWAAGSNPHLTIVDFRPVIAEIRRTLPDRHWQLALKRCMYRAAEQIAQRGPDSNNAIVTGESIGQVSTQTLTNLVSLEAGIDLPVFRPLVAENKDAIVDAARDIDVYELAETLEEPCALQGGRDVTEAPPERLEKIEASLDGNVLDAVIDRADTVDAFELPDDDAATVQIQEVPENAVPVDVRSEEAYERWHPPDALHVPFDVALGQGAALPNEPTYLFYCDVGLKSAHVAERLHQQGFNAFSFDGGIEDLKLEVSGSE